MSKKHFQILATQLGVAAKHNGWTCANHPREFDIAVEAVCSACQLSNHMFSAAMLKNWIWDVAEGRRDSEGKKVRR